MREASERQKGCMSGERDTRKMHVRRATVLAIIGREDAWVGGGGGGGVAEVLIN